MAREVAFHPQEAEVGISQMLDSFYKTINVVRILFAELIPKYAGPSSVTNCERSFEESLISEGAALSAFQRVTLGSKGLYKTS